ncbi:glycosyltransferase family 4 protein [Arthrobacter sp. efr-133-R2A-120]|uniref:glycosyltransferase family 4 protein n=1 Tax=Arthrobacter sp. efr-133-R2A-120 TaxID=3040277 RepID=UPI00254B2A10|nr:glycosyltransferase family 4 protein [Arthrobacter sp. efr-133-R2A-120]
MSPLRKDAGFFVREELWGDVLVRIGIVGPVSPAALAQHIFPEDRARALKDDDSHGPSVGSLTRELLDRGHEVVVITHRRGHDAITLRGPKLKFFQVSSRSSPRRQILDSFRSERKQMGEILAATSVDVVHAHWTYEFALTAVQSSLPLVVTIHDAPITVLAQNRGAYWVLRLLIAIRVRTKLRGARLTAVSPYIGKRWVSEMIWNKGFSVVPNCIDLPGPLNSYLHKEEPTFIEIADDSRRKNVRRLLIAFQIVRRTLPNAKLVLIGGGLGLGDPIQRWASRRGHAANVTFLGRRSRPEVREALSSSTCHVHVSKEESFGLSLIEAMSVGVPVIAGKNSGAPPWVLDGGKTGQLVAVQRVEELVEAMLSTVSSASEVGAKAILAGKRYDEQFSPDVVAKKYLEVYRTAIADAIPIRRRRRSVH